MDRYHEYLDIEGEDEPNTIPGFSIDSNNFQLKFVSGFQKGMVSHNLEYETDWMEVMVILLEMLEKYPTNVKAATSAMGPALEDWIESHEGAHQLNIRTFVTIEEKCWFVAPEGRRKSLHVEFTDKFQTLVLFHVKKKNVMRGLKSLAAEAVANCVEKEDKVEDLEVPVEVKKDVVQSLNNDWTARYFKRNVACLHKERHDDIRF